jgi:hypothetical protein
MPDRFQVPDLSILQNEPAAPEVETGPISGLGELLDREHDRLMAIEGVVMVGEGQDEIGGPAIIVGVKRSDHLRRVPRSVGGVPVVGTVIGEVDALSARGT